MTQNELNIIWDYYLIIEEDLLSTARFVEPAEQEDVYSFEFQKIIILACTEIEKVFKSIAKETGVKEPGNISEYKEIVLDKYPRIIECSVSVRRLGKKIKPFENWNSDKLKWWDAYTNLKHDLDDRIKQATCINAIYAISALYILILYLSEITGLELFNNESKYINSRYGFAKTAISNVSRLPDFDNEKVKPKLGFNLFEF